MKFGSYLFQLGWTPQDALRRLESFFFFFLAFNNHSHFPEIDFKLFENGPTNWWLTAVASLLWDNCWHLSWIVWTHTWMTQINKLANRFYRGPHTCCLLINQACLINSSCCHLSSVLSRCFVQFLASNRCNPPCAVHHLKMYLPHLGVVRASLFISFHF